MGFITGQITVAKCFHHARVVWMCRNFLPFRWRSSYLALSWETFSITRSYSPFDFWTSSCNYIKIQFRFLPPVILFEGGRARRGSVPNPPSGHIQTCYLWSMHCWKVGPAGIQLQCLFVQFLFVISAILLYFKSYYFYFIFSHLVIHFKLANYTGSRL